MNLHDTSLLLMFYSHYDPYYMYPLDYCILLLVLLLLVLL